MLSHAETRSSRPEPRLKPHKRQRLDWAWVLLAVVLLASACMLLYSVMRIMPRVQALGIDLGGMSRARAASVLDKAWQRRSFLVDAGDMSWLVSPPTLGLWLDGRETARKAYERGRSLGRIGALLRGEELVRVPPVLVFDPNVAEMYLQAVRLEIDTPAVDAKVNVQDGVATAIPSVAGRALDIGSTMDQLQARIGEVAREERVDLVVSPVPPAISDITPIVEQINAWLRNELIVRAYDPITNKTLTWVADSGVWSQWISLKVDASDLSAFGWDVHPEAIHAFLAGQEAEVGPDRYLDVNNATVAVQEALTQGRWSVSLRLYHRARQHVVQSGQTIASVARDYGIPYPWILQANPGVGDALRVGQILVIPSPDALLPLPIVEDKRVVVSISQQAMWVYEHGVQVWAWPISTGIESSPTSPGVFQVLSHERNAYAASWDLWMPYFMGIYRPVPTSHFLNGFHGFPTRDGANLLWTGNLGHPVTFGCILISTGNAAALYDWAEEGVIVEVQP